MKTHLVEWKRLVWQGRSCDRCSDTGKTLRAVIRDLNAACAAKPVRFRLKTGRLPATRLAESNRILIDGRPLEQIVPGVVVTETECRSCGELIGRPTSCRAIVADGRTHDVVPAHLIRTALCRVAECCSDDCDCGCGCDKAQPKTRTAKRRTSGGPPCCGLKSDLGRRTLQR